MNILTGILIALTIYTLQLFNLNGLKSKVMLIKDFLNTFKPKKVLFIFPHPDDETFTSAHLALKLMRKNVNIFFVTVTLGEKGTEIMKLPPNELGVIRKGEYEKVMKSLGIKNFETWDFKDSEVGKSKVELKKKIKEFVEKHGFDTVVTYEPGGLYPHPDHIVTSQIVTELAKEMGSFNLLYGTIPEKMRSRMNLPKTIEIDGEIIELKNVRHKSPEFKILGFRTIFRKYRALLNYRSQKLNHNGPLWVQMIFMPFEYYAVGYIKKS